MMEAGHTRHMPEAAPAVTTREDLDTILKTYFAALDGGNLGAVPWSENVKFSTPLLAHAPLEGRAAVQAFFRPMLGRLGPVRLVNVFLNESRDVFVVEAYIGPLHVMDKFVIRSGEIVEQQNIFDPRPALQPAALGAMSISERDLIVDMLAASRNRLRSAVNNISPERWQRKPVNNAWSPAECLEHLTLTEEALLGLIRGTILSSPADPAQSLEQRGKDAAIAQNMASRENKKKAAAFLEPKGNWPQQAASLDAFLARRADTLDFGRSTIDALHHHFAPADDLGLLDGYQWLLLMAAHTDRHVAQMQEAAELDVN